MREIIIQRIENLSDADLAEISTYLDFLKYRSNNLLIGNPLSLLQHFNKYNLSTWKEVATSIRESGIPVGSVGGYMGRNMVVNWLVLTYDLTPEVAKAVITLLTSAGLLVSSYNGNIF